MNTKFKPCKDCKSKISCSRQEQCSPPVTLEALSKAIKDFSKFKRGKSNG